MIEIVGTVWNCTPCLPPSFLATIFFILLIFYWIFDLGSYINLGSPWSAKWSKSRLGSIKGPRPLPFVGNLFSMDPMSPHLKLSKWAEKYGPIYKCYFGSSPVIVLNDIQIIKEAFCGKNAEALSGRVSSTNSDKITGGLGLATNHGRSWLQQKRFTILTLNEICKGPPTEHRMQSEIYRFLVSIDNQSINQSIDLMFHIRLCVARIIRFVLFGGDSGDDALFCRGVASVSALLKIDSVAALANHLPLLARLIPAMFRVPELMQHIGTVEEFISEQIERAWPALETIGDNDDDDNDCFVRRYFRHMSQLSESDRAAAGFSKQQLSKICLELFLGLEDTTAVLAWGGLFLLHNSEAHDSIHAEIHQILGGNQPNWSDRVRLPRTQAIIAEMLRLGCSAPSAMLHVALEDVVLRGQKVPKGCLVVQNIWAAHLDPHTHVSPARFDPHRFMEHEISNDNDNEGNDARISSSKSSNSTIPFSIGRRRCPGESLARMTIFLMTTGIYYNYSILPEGKSKGDRELPSLDCVGGFVSTPQPYKVRLVRRRP